VRRIVAVAGRVLTLGGALAFVLFFKVNLHCTQYTSLGIAMFDAEPHPEEAEGVDGRHAPTVYRLPQGWLLRAYLGLAILASLLAPAVVVFRRPRLACTLGVLLAAVVWPTANSIGLGSAVVGERFAFLGVAASVGSLCLAVVAVLALVVEQKAQ